MELFIGNNRQVPRLSAASLRIIVMVKPKVFFYQCAHAETKTVFTSPVNCAGATDATQKYGTDG